MITVEKLSWSFPQKDLYDDISFTIEKGEHCVLIGSNGTGKSTLVDIIANTDAYILHQGRVKKEPGCTVALVSQFVRHDKDRNISVFDYLAEDFTAMQKEMDEVCAELETAEDYETLTEKYQQLLDAFDAVDGYNYEANIHKRLAKAGLQELEEVPVNMVSGGEYKLVQIIRRMLNLPDLLIMDEPDAFLDFENIAGLRELINSYEGTILVVTHNRFLLNHCFDKVLHLEGQSLREFEGSYADYTLSVLQMKAEMGEKAGKETEWIDIQEQLVEKLRDQATKVIDPYNGKRLRARVSYLERLKKSRTEEPFLEEREVKITLPAVSYEEEPEKVLRVTDYSVAFDKPLLEGVNFEIGPHDKVALVGPNGTGKTTLMRDILFSGKASIELSPEIKTAFLSQVYGDSLHEENTVFEEFEALGMNRNQIRYYLAGYCIDEDALDRKIATLSGGEKNLLQLAEIALGDAQFIMLDEPTSHLDLPAQLALEKAINSYEGAVLMVSHDFYSIAGCVDYVLYTENGTIRRMSGRAFRKMIYRKHFTSDYLELEQRKKELEVKINAMLLRGDYEGAEKQCDALGDVIRRMQ